MIKMYNGRREYYEKRNNSIHHFLTKSEVKIVCGHRVATTALWVMAGMWLRNISLPIIPMNIIGNNS